MSTSIALGIPNNLCMHLCSTIAEEQSQFDPWVIIGGPSGDVPSPNPATKTKHGHVGTPIVLCIPNNLCMHLCSSITELQSQFDTWVILGRPSRDVSSPNTGPRGKWSKSHNKIILVGLMYVTFPGRTQKKQFFLQVLTTLTVPSWHYQIQLRTRCSWEHCRPPGIRHI